MRLPCAPGLSVPIGPQPALIADNCQAAAPSGADYAKTSGSPTTRLVPPAAAVIYLLIGNGGQVASRLLGS